MVCIRIPTIINDKLIFLSGDESKWIIADKNVITPNYKKQHNVRKSSINPFLHRLPWNMEKANNKAPVLSLSDGADILYTENGQVDSKGLISDVKYMGVNVFIRNQQGKMLS